jgi:2-oxoisovalerate dehydrogenase E1 component
MNVKEANQVKINHKQIKEALLIRKVEEKFLELFSLGKLNGTVHTCVGQEFSAVAFAGQLKKKDFIFSNHRCHGHYISFTKDVRGLLAELLGKRTGTSGGVGSSQHLQNGNFYSNGIQGGIMPVAAGFALANKLSGNDAIGIVFIGDGTLGEGVVYETMNIISKWKIPLLIVCENNFYAQSTPQSTNLAGDILKRAEAFGISTYKGNTWNPGELMDSAKEVIETVRASGNPAFFLVDTYRLNAHSKGDDDRSKEEVQSYRDKDFLTTFQQESPDYYNTYSDSIDKEIKHLLEEISIESDLQLHEYYKPIKVESNDDWKPLVPNPKRQVELINSFFREQMVVNDAIVFIGEDIMSPYGGAFKVSKDLSNLKPGRVLSTPISEAAIMGISNGLALNGFKPFAEIMFGDFITLAFDQLVNHASKFHHIFNLKVKCPVVLRTPMGGWRGYGPTHSQTLDKFLIGLDNVTTVAINTLIDPQVIFNQVLKLDHPAVIIENKADYGKRILAHQSKNFVYEVNGDPFPVIRVRPINSDAELTLVTYGGMADMVNAYLEDIFIETDLKVELLVITQISPLNPEQILNSVKKTKRLAVIEEGSAAGGMGSEIIASVMETMNEPITVRRIAALPVPIPSVQSLEHEVLPDKKRIIIELKQHFT